MPPELAYRQITLQFQLGVNAPEAFPFGVLGHALWQAPGSPGQSPLPADRVPPTPWDDSLYGLIAMGDFAAADPQWRGDAEHIDTAHLKWQPTANNSHVGFVTGEIEALKRLMAQDRERYMGEILAQQNNAPDYWVGMFNLGRSRTPWTLRLLFMASRIAELVSMRAKLFYDRPRPSELCPGLMPPYGPPAHASFPSAHATQSFLIAYCLDHAMRPSGGDVSPYRDQLFWLARRITLNRERGGFHYRSDSDAGECLAQKVFKRLTALKSSGANRPDPADPPNPDPEPARHPAPVVKQVFDRAQAEWRRPSTTTAAATPPPQRGKAPRAQRSQRK
ncbi:hypothetical protein [Elioraea sp.]|uniref:hypothetical protein n=1 Tax=Elioraea sp. TaxID=2185103 RepID=UPI003F6F6451